MHSSPKPFAAPAAVASSRLRKPSASGSKPFTRLHSPIVKSPAHTERPIEKKADVAPAVVLQSEKERSAVSDEALKDEKVAVKDEVSRMAKAVVTGEALRENKAGIEDERLKKGNALTEDEAVGREKVMSKDGALGEETFADTDEAFRKADDQSSVCLSQVLKQNSNPGKQDTNGDDCTDILGEEEEKNGDSTEISVTENCEENLIAAGYQTAGASFDAKVKLLDLENGTANTDNTSPYLLMIPVQQDLNSALAETETVVGSEQNPTFSACTGQRVPGFSEMERELHVKCSGHGLLFAEHLDSEQEGFLFAKGEPLFRESMQGSESLAVADLGMAPSESSVAHNALIPMPFPEATGFMEAALAKDGLAAKFHCLQNVKCQAVARSALSWTWIMWRRNFIIPSLVLPVVLVLVLAMTRDKTHCLHPT